MEEEKVKKTAKGRKRSDAEILDDTRMAMGFYLKGVRYAEISHTIGALRDYTVTPQQVYKDITKCLEDWKKEKTDLVTRYKQTALAKLTLMEQTYWASWEESKAAKVKDVTKQFGPAASATHVAIEKHSTTSVGDSKFLDGLQWCFEQYCKITGVYAQPGTPGGGESAGDQGDGSQAQVIAREIIFRTYERPVPTLPTEPTYEIT